MPCAAIDNGITVRVRGVVRQNACCLCEKFGLLRGRLTDASLVVRATARTVLRNDYETITNAITVKMAEKFSERRGVESITSGVRDVSAAAAPPVSPVQTMDTNAATRTFAIIDQVMDDSPGCVDGLRVGDRVCAVGDVRWGFDDPSATPPSDLIPQAARAFGESENHPVRVVILRRGERVEITVTPRAWSGAGLVGCHMCTV
jgi:26S proteasome regulatory subunit N4